MCALWPTVQRGGNRADARLVPVLRREAGGAVSPFDPDGDDDLTAWLWLGFAVCWLWSLGTLATYMLLETHTF